MQFCHSAPFFSSIHCFCESWAMCWSIKVLQLLQLLLGLCGSVLRGQFGSPFSQLWVRILDDPDGCSAVGSHRRKFLSRISLYLAKNEWVVSNSWLLRLIFGVWPTFKSQTQQSCSMNSVISKNICLKTWWCYSNTNPSSVDFFSHFQGGFSNGHSWEEWALLSR